MMSSRLIWGSYWSLLTSSYGFVWLWGISPGLRLNRSQRTLKTVHVADAPSNDWYYHYIHMFSIWYPCVFIYIYTYLYIYIFIYTYVYPAYIHMICIAYFLPFFFKASLNLQSPLGRRNCLGPRYVIYAGTAIMKLDSEGAPTKELAEAERGRHGAPFFVTLPQ